MLHEIVFKFGATPKSPPLRIKPGAMTVLVGPNSSGKSLTLREIKTLISTNPSEHEHKFDIINSVIPELPHSGALLKRLLRDVELDIAPFREPLLAAANLTPAEIINNFDPSNIFPLLQELNCRMD